MKRRKTSISRPGEQPDRHCTCEIPGVSERAQIVRFAEFLAERRLAHQLQTVDRRLGNEATSRPCDRRADPCSGTFDATDRTATQGRDSDCLAGAFHRHSPLRLGRGGCPIRGPPDDLPAVGREAARMGNSRRGRRFLAFGSYARCRPLCRRQRSAGGMARCRAAIRPPLRTEVELLSASF